MPAEMAGKSSETMTADAEVVLAMAAYLGLATKVMCPAAASSMPATPVISVLPSALSSVAFRAEAMSESFMMLIGVAISA